MSIIIAIVLFLTNYIFGIAGKKNNDDSNIYNVFFGPKISKMVDIYVTIFSFLSYIIMISGAESTAKQQFSFPTSIGCVTMILLVLITIIFGLKKMSNFLGRIVPIMILVILIISLVNIINNFDYIDFNINLIQNKEIEFKSIDNNWILSIISNMGVSIIWLSKFSMSLSRKQPIKKIFFSNWVFSIVIGIIYIVIAFSILSSFPQVCMLDIPNLYIANSLWPPLAIILSFVIFVSIYTSACPLLWNSVSFFAKDKTKNYYITSIILSIIGLIVSILVPYADLLNIVYKYNGYIGFLFFLIIFIEFVVFKIKTNVKLQKNR